MAALYPFTATLVFLGALAPCKINEIFANKGRNSKHTHTHTQEK